jgi:hypothetical protein
MELIKLINLHEKIIYIYLQWYPRPDQPYRLSHLKITPSLISYQSFPFELNAQATQICGIQPQNLRSLSEVFPGRI